MSTISPPSKQTPQIIGHSLAERLAQHPQLCQRVEEILALVENTGEGCQTADEAERRTISAVRQLGQEILTDWTKTQAQFKASEYGDQKGIQSAGKKNCIGIAPMEG